MNVIIPPLRLDEGTGNTIALFGASKCGKTVLWTSIFRSKFYNKEYISTLFAGNPQIDDYDGMDKYLIKLEGFELPQRGYLKAQHYVQRRTKNKYNFLNIFDDQVAVRYTPELTQLLLSWRNSKMSTIICLQGVVLMNKQGRGSLNNAIFMHCNSDELIEQTLVIFLRSLLQSIGVQKNNQAMWYRDQTRDYNYLYLHIPSSTLWSSQSRSYLIKDGIPNK